MLEVKIKRQLAFFTLEADFTLGKEIMVLFGPSGSGKTSLLWAVSGLSKVEEGRIVLNDRVLFDSREKINLPTQKRKVGFVFQDYALFPHYTVEKNIAYGCKQKGHRPDKDWLEIFGIAHLAKRYPQQLSGGEGQRVALARALASNPDLLLLDEPFSALDKKNRMHLREELRKLNQQWQIPFIVVSHDEDDATYLADVKAHIDDGRLVLER